MIADPTTPVLILGAGGHARVLLAVLRTLGREVRGCIAPTEPAADWPDDCPWLGREDHLDAVDRTAVCLVNGVGSIGSTAVRQGVFDRAVARGFRFVPLVHPSAVLAGPVGVGDGAQIMAGAVLQTGVTVGENAIINTGVIVDHDCQIGDHCHLAPGVVLSGGVTLGVGAHVGTGATVIQGLGIGAGALVAAGAVVIRPVADGERVAGVPARPMVSGHGTDSRQERA